MMSLHFYITVFFFYVESVNIIFLEYGLLYIIIIEGSAEACLSFVVCYTKINYLSVNLYIIDRNADVCDDLLDS